MALLALIIYQKWSYTVTTRVHMDRELGGSHSFQSSSVKDSLKSELILSELECRIQMDRVVEFLKTVFAVFGNHTVHLSTRIV